MVKGALVIGLFAIIFAGVGGVGATVAGSPYDLFPRSSVVTVQPVWQTPHGWTFNTNMMDSVNRYMLNMLNETRTRNLNHRVFHSPAIPQSRMYPSPLNESGIGKPVWEKPVWEKPVWESGYNTNMMDSVNRYMLSMLEETRILSQNLRIFK